MNKIDPEVGKYLQELHKFFESNERYFTQIYGGHKISECMAIIKEYAISNLEQYGEPQLTRKQFLEVRAKLDGYDPYMIFQNKEYLFIHFQGYPLVCLN